MLNKISCLLILALLSTCLIAQTSGTMSVSKLPPPDTISILYGDPQYYKFKKVRYKSSLDSKATYCIDYLFRKRVGQAYYIVTYADSITTYSRGAIRKGSMHGAWSFFKTDGKLYAEREYHYGRLLGRYGLL